MIPSALPVLGEEAPGADFGVVRGADFQRPALERTRPSSTGRRRRWPAPSRCGPSRGGRPPDDLAAAGLDRHAVELAPAVRFLRAQQRGPSLAPPSRVPPNEFAPSRRPHSRAACRASADKSIFSRSASRRAATRRPRAGRHAVADRVELVEAVADVDDADALSL